MFTYPITFLGHNVGGGGGGGGPATYVQHNSATTSAGTSLDVVLTGVTAGNMIVLCIGEDSTSSANTFSATDDVDSGSYTVAGHNYANSDRVSAILYYGNSSGGTVTITVTSASNERFFVTAVEVSNAGSSPVVTYAENDNGTGATKYATPATGFSPPADSLVLAVFVCNVPPTSYTAGSGYTAIYNAGSTNPNGLVQYREFTSLSTNHRPECTVTDTTRSGPACAVHIQGT